ncbi:MAG: tetratricopeptide repeat protein [Armatimonadetes bacterium]|nr:tetratricopeptide repeat protein [Armatimonadota bacterium]
MGRDAEAAQYWEQAKDAVGYLPDYFMVGGFVAAADGDLNAARSRFAAGARREHGKYTKCDCLAAVADLALAKGDAAALQAALGHAPPSFRAVGAELLADPSPAKAAEALRHCGWWLNRAGYAAGQLDQVAVTPTPAPTPLVGGEPQPAPAVPAQPAAPAAAPTAPAAAPAVPEPKPAAVQQESLAAAAAAAYRSAQKLLVAGKLAEAEAALGSAVRLHPRLAEAWYALGWIHSLRNDYADALYDYATALRVVPDWADAAYGLAQAEDRLGVGEPARWYDRALELGLQGPSADYARSRAAALRRGR